MIFQSIFAAVTKSHVVRRVLRTPAAHLFDIVQDVDRYADFLPYCLHSKVHQRSADGNTFTATLHIGFGHFTEEYTSQVRLDRSNWTITSTSTKSRLMESLYSQWRLQDIDDARCHVDFTVEMTVSDPLLTQTLDQFLPRVAEQQVNAFEKRCANIPLRQSRQ